jgi:perosamine synthetase
MRRILAVARRFGLAVIEDACEAIGAEFEGGRVGSFGDVAVFGFYPNKQITTGEGGAVTTRHPELAARLRVLRNQGRSPSDDWLQHTELGYNYRLSEINCALGLGQLKRLEEILERREDVARLYHRSLSGTEGLVLPALDVPGCRVSWFVYVVRLDASYTAEDRDSIVRHMREAGIGCGRYFGPIHLQPAYSTWRNARAMEVTETQACRTIALPFFNRIGEEQIVEVCTALRTAMTQLRRVDSRA